MPASILKRAVVVSRVPRYVGRRWGRHFVIAIDHAPGAGWAGLETRQLRTAALQLKTYSSMDIAAATAGPQPKVDQEAAAGAEGWVSLGTPAAELQLEVTLPTGQSFRWQRSRPDEFTGVVGQRVVQLRQLEDDVAYRVLARGETACPSQDAAALRDYFNLGTSLAALAAQWSAADPRFRHVHPYLQGARMLRQDPVECLFQFVCSSNNHISRIHGMVERLCRRYGTPLHGAHTPPLQQLRQQEQHQSPPLAAKPPVAAGLGPDLGSSLAAAAAADAAPVAAAAALATLAPAGAADMAASSGAACLVQNGSSAALATAAAAAPAAAACPREEPAAEDKQQQRQLYYAFPTLEQLAAATEEALREDGFGYRAKFITGSVAALLEKPGGGVAWLHGLRSVPFEEAVEELSALPGVGPKVAACVCLFSLDKHEAIPVDTHVWQLATRYYTPHLKGKALTKKVHGAVQAAFVDRFGPYAGWAHNTLFISELASTKGRIPTAAAASAAAVLAEAGDADAVWEPASSDRPKAAKVQKKGSKGKAKTPSVSAAGAGLGAAVMAKGAAKRRRAAVADVAAEGEGQQGLAGWRQRKVRGE